MQNKTDIFQCHYGKTKVLSTELVSIRYTYYSNIINNFLADSGRVAYLHAKC